MFLDEVCIQTAFLMPWIREAKGKPGFRDFQNRFKGVILFRQNQRLFASKKNSL